MARRLSYVRGQMAAAPTIAVTRSSSAADREHSGLLAEAQNLVLDALERGADV
jgi:hypothetical protein